MSNTKPDFSRDPERVALAKVLREAVRSTFRSVSVPNWETMDTEWKHEYLFMADAAITHLGSGYRLPEATEANAERLAIAEWTALPSVTPWNEVTGATRADWRVRARRYLEALPIAFSDPAEKPERRTADDWLPRCPVTLDGKRCNLAVHADDVNHDNGETSWLEAQPLQKAQQFEPRKMDATERGERRRERQKLVWEAMMAIGSSYRCTGSTSMGIAITYVDNYLAWRDADTAKEMGAYKK